MFNVEGHGDEGCSYCSRWLSPCAWLPSCPSSLLTAPVGLQVFHCHFNSNFFPLFLEHLLSDHISLSMGSFLLGECVPWIGWKDRGLHPRNPIPAIGTATSPAGAQVLEGRVCCGVAPPAPSSFPEEGAKACWWCEGVGLLSLVVLLVIVLPRGDEAQWLVNSEDYSVTSLGVSLDCLFTVWPWVCSI